MEFYFINFLLYSIIIDKRDWEEKEMKKILFVASEAVPFIKTGGLADVVGSLPKYFSKEHYDVRVMIPKYRAIPESFRNQMQYQAHFYMKLAWRNQYVGILRMDYQGIPFYFIDNEFYFAGFGPYGNIYEDIEKFAFFCRAALSALPVVDFHPDVIHCHDWQTALIPVYLKDTFAQGPFYQGIRTVLTIHNLKFQGIWDLKTVKDITGLSSYYFSADKLEAYGDANYLKGGMVYADRITTVSHSYANEIQTAFYGEGLDGVVRSRRNALTGIINGIDYDVYNPQTDSYLVQPYNAKTFRKEKKKNKRALQQELGLEQNDDIFMISIISRLTSQKGLDLVDYMIESICAQDTQLVVIGTGEERYENLFRHFAWKYPGRVSANIFYSEERAHKIYAASDALLMPSLFEPCGLTQLIALRYGTIPIVRETGGLRDTVQPYNEYESTGTGFSFCNYNAHEMQATIDYAKRVYYTRRREWNKMIDRGMAMNYSWEVSAKAYEHLYQF